jgi:hypothetical protein
MDELNNITQTISTFLEKKNPCTEHEILRKLKSDKVAPFDQLNLKHSKDLFCAHFLTMHALYQLQNDYLGKQQYCLEIHSIKIERRPYFSDSTTNDSPPSLTFHDPLKDYYLDISHYFETSENEVNELLNSFWKTYLAQDDKQQALTTLELPANSSYASIKKQYRLLAQKHHPDKGGCGKYFAKINAAKSILDTFY